VLKRWEFGGMGYERNRSFTFETFIIMFAVGGQVRVGVRDVRI
jgi:hypothetical protein